MAQEKDLQRLLNKIAKDSLRAQAMARELYGSQAQIFAQADGDLHAMSDDCDGPGRARQSFIRLSSKSHHAFGVGSW